MKRFTKDLQHGDWGIEVRKLQDFLEMKGYGIFKDLPIRFFGDTTYSRVKQFQTDNGITPVSGYFGQKSRGVANKTISEFNSNLLYQTATSFLGVDASPDDLAPDEYGCAETVDNIVCKALGAFIGNGNSPTLSTSHLYIELLFNGNFAASDVPSQGGIIISPTGYGNGALAHGHVGIIGTGQLVMSNSSFNGKFEVNYTIDSWRARYQIKGGYPVYFFRSL